MEVQLQPHFFVVSLSYREHSRNHRNVIPAALLSYRHHVKERYVQLETCEPSEKSGVARWEKTKIAFCVALLGSKTAEHVTEEQTA
jgi:hypothetical protein